MINYSARVISMLALIATILAPVLFFAARISLDAAKQWMLIAMIIWYVCALMWMKIKPTE
jgi:hypothetical protein